MYSQKFSTALIFSMHMNCYVGGRMIPSLGKWPFCLFRNSKEFYYGFCQIILSSSINISHLIIAVLVWVREATTHDSDIVTLGSENVCIWMPVAGKQFNDVFNDISHFWPLVDQCEKQDTGLDGPFVWSCRTHAPLFCLSENIVLKRTAHLFTCPLYLERYLSK